MRVGSNLCIQFGVLDGTDHLVTPEGYLAAARARAEAGFDHVELSADAHTYNRAVFAPRSVARLGELRGAFGISFSLHLHSTPGINLDSPNQTARRAAVAATLEVIDALRPLEIRHIVTHALWGCVTAQQLANSQQPPSAKQAVLSQMAEMTASSLQELVRYVDARHLCLENLFIDFQPVWQLVQAFDTSVCFDGGHWHRMGHEAMAFVERYGHRVAIVHCHDVVDGADHQRLRQPLTIPWGRVLTRLEERGFDGPVVLEMSRDADVYASLPVFRGLMSVPDIAGSL